MSQDAHKHKVVGGKDQEATRREEARRRARPILGRWLREIEAAVADGRLIAIDFLFAKEMTRCGPSANAGFCYAGQIRLGGAVGRCDRTARRSLQRLCAGKFLSGRRGGTERRTASWTFCIDGTPIFDQVVSGLTGHSCPIKPDIRVLSDRTKMSAKLTEDNNTHIEPTKTKPTTTTTTIAPPSAAPDRKRSGEEGSKPKRRGDIQQVQNELVSRLGRGDVAQGWVVFGELPIDVRRALETMQADGELTDQLLADFLARVVEQQEGAAR
jgi:hypothetical protein